MTKSHTNKAYDNELRLLSDRILLIAGRAEKMVFSSFQALAQNDAVLAKANIEYDQNIDRDEIMIDKLCLELLARRQPLGQDLRFIVSVLKMVTYFERIGDLAVKICQRVIKLKSSKIETDIDGIEAMARGVQAMIKETVEAFVLKNCQKADSVIRQDDDIDEIYHTTTKRFIKEMVDSKQDAESYYHLLSIAKWLERMGDHCTNLAELIIFMINGEDVRHKQSDKSDRVSRV